MPISKKVSLPCFAFSLTWKGIKICKALQMIWSIQIWELIFKAPGSHFISQFYLTQTLVCDLLLIQISGEEVVIASLSHWSPSSDFLPWQWPLPMILLHPIYCPCFPIVNWSWPPTKSSFPYVLQEHRNLLSWWHTSDNIFFYKNNTELWTELFMRGKDGGGRGVGEKRILLTPSQWE